MHVLSKFLQGQVKIQCVYKNKEKTCIFLLHDLNWSRHPKERQRHAEINSSLITNIIFFDLIVIVQCLKYSTSVDIRNWLVNIMKSLSLWRHAKWRDFDCEFTEHKFHFLFYYCVQKAITCSMYYVERPRVAFHDHEIQRKP